MKREIASLAFVVVLAAVPSFAERVQVFSVQGADCAECADKIRGELKKTKGVGKVEFDKQKVELTVKLDDGVADDAVVAAVERAGFKAMKGTPASRTARATSSVSGRLKASGFSTKSGLRAESRSSTASRWQPEAKRSTASTSLCWASSRPSLKRAFTP